jgi:hypothetical protein
MVSMDRQKVVDIPVTCLFLMLMSSSYVKLYICMLRRHRFLHMQICHYGAGHGRPPVMRLRGGDAR